MLRCKQHKIAAYGATSERCAERRTGVHDMPYSAGNDPNLPDRVKKLPSAKRKRQWVHIFNSAYAGCTRDGGDKKTCESKAFAQANGVVFNQGGKRST
jgi:hypothetical protein